MRTTPWPMIGRDLELASLRAAWTDRARPGALVTGAAGVGKSRLVAEFLRGAEADGATVVRAVGSRSTAEIPLGALAVLVPDGHLALDRQAALIDLVIDGLRQREQPLIFAVDDVGLLDPTSQAVVAAVLRREVCFIVGTQRDGATDFDPSPWDDAGALGIELGDLTLDAVAQLLEDVVGGPVAGDAAHQVWRSARGNPLLVRELTMATIQSGALASHDGVWQLRPGMTPSPRLRELVAERLARATAAERDVLELVAVAGSLPDGLAQQLVAVPAIERCVADGLAWWASFDGLSELRLAHPVYGEVLLGDLGVLGRRRLTARLLDGARRAPDRSIDVLRLATWQLDAGDGGDPALLVSAARRARRLSELDLAVRLLTAALHEGAGEEALSLLGEVQFTAGHYAEAEVSYREAQDLLTSRLAARAADPRLVAALGFVGTARGWNLAWGLGRAEEARAMNRAVRDRVAEVDPIAAGELEAEGACYLAIGGRPDRAVVEARAVPPGPPRVEVRRHHAVALAELGLGHVDEALAAAVAGMSAAQELPPGFGRESFGFVFAVARAEALVLAGDLDGGSAVAVASYDGAVATGHLSGQAISAWARGRVELARGRVDGARRWFQESAALERLLGTTRGRSRWAPAGLAMSMAMADDASAAHSVLDGIDELDVADPIDVVFLAGEVGRARGRAFAAAGDHASAMAVLQQTIERCQFEWAVAVEVAARHDVLLLADGREARRSAEALLERVGLVQGAPAELRARHAQAVLDQSAPALEQVARQFADLGAHRMAADIAAGAARQLDGRATARACASLRERAEGWLREIGGSRATDADWALRRLPPRQREVVRLAAAGLTNAEIAERLGRSPRTIENHLYRSYQQLGVDDRLGLRAVLAGEDPTGG